MSDEQLAKKLQGEENKFMIIMGSILGLIWVILILIDVFGGVIDGSLYFLYGIFNLGAFIFYSRARNKRSQEQWIKTSLFEEQDEKKEE